MPPANTIIFVYEQCKMKYRYFIPLVPVFFVLSKTVSYPELIGRRLF
jgi:hypothetical protein